MGIYPERPKEWPVNDRERKLDLVIFLAEKFIKNPDSETREQLISSVVKSEINETSNRGLIRVTDYEVCIINTLYMYSLCLNLASIRLFLYRTIADTTIFSKITYQTISNENDEIEAYTFLHPTLGFFYKIFYKYKHENIRSFPDELIRTMKDCMTIYNGDELKEISENFIQVVYDLSYNNNPNINGYMNWSRQEIKRIFEVISKILEITRESPVNHPLRGIISIALANWILHSRNDYNYDYMYKCASNKSVKNIFDSGEIWMHEIVLTNDKRESKFIKDIFNNKKWVKYEWAKQPDLVFHNRCYISCFSKTKPNASMIKKYGGNVFGYKSDKIGDLISPLYKNDPLSSFSPGMYFDVVYSAEKSKTEINYLCDLINLLKIEEKDKKDIYNHVLQYFLLSFKDKKWESEKERRYQFFVNTDSNIDSKIENGFLKVKSQLFAYPDFILGDNIEYEQIRKNRFIKLSGAKKSYCFCADCLQSDFNVISSDSKSRCSICGSDNIEYFDK